MQARVKLVKGLSFIGESASGNYHGWQQRRKGSNSNENATYVHCDCSSIDMVSILQKGRADVRDYEVKLTSTRCEKAPRLFNQINLYLIVTGRDLTDKIIERAVALSAKKVLLFRSR